MNEVKLTISEKVIMALKEQGRTKVWLSNQFGVEYPTIFYKLKHNNWSVAEIYLLKKLLNID